MKSVAVIGLGFGDEGKGLVTNWLAQHNQFETNTRFSGGHQVGHTVVTDEFRHVFQNFGSATASGVATVWSKDCCIDPIKIKEEYEQLKKFGLSPKIYIHEECAVTTPYDVVVSMNRANLHTVRDGVEKTFKRELDGCHFQAKHLIFPAVLEGKLNGLSNYYKLFESMIEIIDTFKEAVQFILDSEDILIVPQHVFNDFDKIPSIYEGSQGLLLDEKIGFYPNVNWGNLLPPKDIDVFMVTRAYKTRRGAGFFNDKKITEHINIPNISQEDFRYDILDLDLLQYSASHIPLAHRNLVITCLDHIDEYVYIYKGIPNMCSSKQRFLEDIASVVGVNSAYYSESPYSENIKRFI